MKYKGKKAKKKNKRNINFYKKSTKIYGKEKDKTKQKKGRRLINFLISETKCPTVTVR